MFFRGRNGKQSAPAEPARVQPEKPAPAPEEAAPQSPAPAAAAPNAGKQLSPEDLKKRAEVSQRLAATMGRLVRLMAGSPRHRDRKLADLEWLALPPVRTGQCALMEAQSRSNGHVTPVAAVLWARVSADVDKRLSERLDEPIRLAPSKVRGGALTPAARPGCGCAGLVPRGIHRCRPGQRHRQHPDADQLPLHDAGL